jgi:C4-dicarboxylate transporter, DctM subunit
MDYGTAGMICLVAMMVFMMLGTPIAYSLGVSAIIAGLLAFGPASLDKVGWSTFQLLYSLTWTTLPLFILMAALIAETSIGKDLFNAASKWMSRIPGGLIAASIVGEAAMASIMATSGSCIAAVGKVASPEYDRFGYDKGLAFGALLCGGVLGPLIPPSTTMIIYAIFAEASIGHLFIAGIIPGIILTIMLAGTAVFMCWRNPSLGPPQGAVPWKERIISLKGIWPVVVLMLAVLGAIYFGIATATEAGGFGVVAVMILGITLFKLRWPGIRRAMIESATITGMIVFIIIGAQYFAYIVSSSGVGQAIGNWVVGMNLAPIMIVVMINILYLVLGCFLDGLTILMVTLPIFIPLMRMLHMDLVWFGVTVVVNMQIGLITPPFGIDMYLVQNMFKIPSAKLFKGTMPFLIMLVIFLGVIIAVPQFSLWLPSMMMAR